MLMRLHMRWNEYLRSAFTWIIRMSKVVHSGCFRRPILSECFRMTRFTIWQTTFRLSIVMLRQAEFC